MKPATNYASVSHDVDLYEDRLRRAVFYVPKAIYEPLGEQELGEKRHILQGSVRYGLSDNLRDLISAEFPGRTLAGVEIDHFSFVNPFPAPSVEHTINVVVLSQVPYPKLVMSATLDKQAADYDEILSHIRTKWNNGTLFDGGMTISIHGETLSVKFSVVIDNNVIKNIREAELGHDNLSQNLIVNFIDGIIMDGHVGGGSEFGEIADALRNEYIATYVLGEHFVLSDGVVLDDGTKIRLWSQSDVRSDSIHVEYIGIIGSDTSITKTI